MYYKDQSMSSPAFYAVHQRFDAPFISDVAKVVREQFASFTPTKPIKAGQRVALAVGSRGVADIDILARTTVECLRDMGLEPFVIPAMGSHGGATARGQIEVLKELGVTEQSVGAPIVSNMDVVSLGRLDCGAEIFCAKDVMEADHLVVINRVKPHTAFRSDVESGLCKILTVGCGKHRGASNLHKYSLVKTIKAGARLVMAKVSVLCGLAVVESPSHRIHTMRLTGAEAIENTDRELLKIAWKMLPRIPLDDLDIIIIDEMGKNISGAGIDPNVTGLWRREGGERTPDYRIMIVLDLTPHSHGNATGVGMVDIIPQRLRDKIDMHATYTNALTSWVVRAARLPLTLENDRVVIDTALSKVPDPANVRMARIVNTMELDTFWATAAVLPELRRRDHIDIEEQSLELVFDAQNRLLPFPK
jgi:hypothetical protein